MIEPLYIGIFILLILIVIVWYWAGRIKNVAETVALDFSGRDCHMTPWIDYEIPKSYQSKDGREVALQLLNQVYGYKTNKVDRIAIGINLYEKYYKLTGRTPDQFYDLRSTIGVDYQIVITDRKMAEQLNEDRDYSRLVDILDHPKHLAELMKYFKTTMEWRWNQLQMTDGNSYFYSSVEIPNVKGKSTPLGYRYNLSTTEKEFIAFIKRYQKALTNQTEQLID